MKCGLFDEMCTLASDYFGLGFT